MKRDLLIFRAIETIVALVLVAVLCQVLNAGVLTSLGRSATGWYSGEVDGLFPITVVDTSIKPPRLDRASLPIPPAPDLPVSPTTSGDATTLSAT